MRNASFEFRKFVNLKEGINLSKIHELPVHDPSRLFIRRELARLVDEHAISERPCVKEDECDNDPSCCCTLMPGFGDAILENTLNELLKMSIQKLKESLCPSIRSEWLDIGSIVFSWCCARTKVAV